MLVIVTADVINRSLGGGEGLKGQRGSSKRPLVSQARWGWRERMRLAPSYRTRQQCDPFCLNRCWDRIPISFGVCRERGSK